MTIDVLVAICHHTGWVETLAVDSVTAENVAKIILKKIILLHGSPKKS